MKTYNIDIHPQLKSVTFSVKSGRKFEQSLIKGSYRRFKIDVTDKDKKRVRQFAVKNGNDNSSNRGNWYAHCNGYAMDLMVTNAGKVFFINTYRPYGTK